MVLRYEDVDQTNDFVELQVKATGFEETGAFAFELARVRSLGDFVEIYSSDRKRNYGLI